MRADRFAGWLLPLLGVIVVAAGFFAVGGISSARMERRDLERLESMYELEACLIQQFSGRRPLVLPETLEASSCASADYARDPFSGQPFRYERRSEQSFAICAEFELKGRDYHSWQSIFEAESGCMLTEISVE